MTQNSIVTNLGLLFVFAFSLIVLTQAEIKDDKNTITLQWYDNVTAATVEPHYDLDTTKHLVQHTELYNELNGTFFVEGTNFTYYFPDSSSWRKSAGFVDTVFYGYQKHHNLIIRPDDVWTAIVIQFSLYVNANAEALRHSFVNFEGKKKLEVKFYQPIDQVPIDVFINKIVDLILQNIDPTIAMWAEPTFTTTTVNDKLTAGVALMATVKKYFDYRISLILCGIPEVTILGDVDDWMEIRRRVGKLREFELDGEDVMDKWSSMLGIILDEFVNVKEGKMKNDEFWQHAIRVDYETVNLGCAKINETYLNGWITAFSAFDKSGNWQKERKFTTSTENLSSSTTPWLSIRTDHITPGVVHAPIKIYDQFAKAEEREYTGAVIVGHMGYSVKKDETTLQPLSGWAMTITNKPPDYLINNSEHEVLILTQSDENKEMF